MSPTVRRPSLPSTSSALSPTPHSALTGSGCRKSSSPVSPTTSRPSGLHRAEAIFEQAKRQQRRMPFIHVVDGRQAAQLVQQLHAGNAQHRLLAQPVVGVAAVEVVGQRAIVGIVAVDIGVSA